MAVAKTIERDLNRELLNSISGGRELIHVIVGPRQIGKTTAARQIEKKAGLPAIYSAADRVQSVGTEWIETQWILARSRAKDEKKPVLLILDEIQKIRNWSEQVKSLWDEDRRGRNKILPLLLGSSSLLLHQGLSESLAGRFRLFRFSHWTWPECKAAFGWDLNRWLFFGGYPGAARLADHEEEWREYVTDSLVETAITRDVVQLQTVTKPTLMRHLFAFAALYPSQIFSYNKMLGQLQDAGNTTTLSHYLDLLETAFLISGLEAYSVGKKRKRGSSPKLVLWNNALVNAFSGKSFKEASTDPAWWGRIVENAVGAHLVNHLQSVRYEVSYWREKNAEVDFVVQAGSHVWAIEVKSGRPQKAFGLDAFSKEYPRAKRLLVGRGGMGLDDFFSTDPRKLFE